MPSVNLFSFALYLYPLLSVSNKSLNKIDLFSRISSRTFKNNASPLFANPIFANKIERFITFIKFCFSILFSSQAASKYAGKCGL